MSKRYLTAVFALKIAIALYLLAMAFGGVENIISDPENGFAVSYWNHTVETYDARGYRLASVKTAGRTELAAYADGDIVIYSHNRQAAEYYASSGDYLYDVEFDYSGFVNTKRSQHYIDGSRLVYTNTLGFERLTLVTPDGERLIYDGTMYMLTKLFAFYFAAFLVYMRILWDKRTSPDR